MLDIPCYLDISLERVSGMSPANFASAVSQTIDCEQKGTLRRAYLTGGEIPLSFDALFGFVLPCGFENKPLCCCRGA
jgi:hypothetical protein